ncbi:MAG: GNAT family N-acetyltransferase [Anaerovoracaceae bacterium]|jgi:ribosomal protein S18 acetylase RimI-like enzyme
MEFRKCTMDDLELVSRFYDKVVDHLVSTVNYPKWIPGVYPGRDSTREVISKGAQYMCIDGDSVLGACNYTPEPLDDYTRAGWLTPTAPGKFIGLRTVAADPEHKKGVGTFMVSSAVEMARSQGYQSLRVETVPNNLPARKMFENAGFRFVEIFDLNIEMNGIPQVALYEKIL